MPAVLARVPQAVLLLTEYGADPAYRASVSASIARLGLGDRVRFIGTRPHDAVAALYSLAEATAGVPSSDGLPQSLFETMSCGTPAVLGRLPAYEEVVRDGESALLVAIEAPAIAAALLRLLEDRALARLVSGNALAAVRGMSALPQEAARVEALYERALAAPARACPRWPRIVDALSLLFR